MYEEMSYRLVISNESFSLRKYLIHCGYSYKVFVLPFTYTVSIIVIIINILEVASLTLCKSIVDNIICL